MQIEISPDTQTRLNTLLDYVGTTAKDADGFVREQAPQVAQEIVAWEFWSSVSLLGGAIFGMVAAILIVPRVKRAWDKIDNQAWGIGAEIACIFGLILCPIAVVVNTHNMFKACVAPRLVVLDYIKARK